MWAYYLPLYLSKAGCEIVSIEIPAEKHFQIGFFQDFNFEPDIFAVLAIPLRYFTAQPEVYKILNDKVKGPICQIYDGSLLDGGGCDITFTLRDDKWRYPLGCENNRYQRHHLFNKYIGWAADANIFCNNQPKDILNIFIDHANFSSSCSDRTLDILMNLRGLIKNKSLWNKKYKSIHIKRLVSGQIVEVDLINNPLNVEEYDRKGIPLTEFCQSISQNHIFFVTHTESVGQCVIEAATAGALIVSPSGLIKPDRLATVRAIEFDRLPITWEPILEAINPALSREVAISNNSWNLIADRIINSLTSHSE